MTAKIKIAAREDIPRVADFLLAMQDEIQEVGLERESLVKNLGDNFGNVTWFLFLDENDVPFGTKYAEKHNAYWSDKFRYYLGGMYIAPAFRGKGYYRQIMDQVEEWAKKQGAGELFAMTAAENERSAKALQSTGLLGYDYKNHMKRI